MTSVFLLLYKINDCSKYETAIFQTEKGLKWFIKELNKQKPQILKIFEIKNSCFVEELKFFVSKEDVNLKPVLTNKENSDYGKLYILVFRTPTKLSSTISEKESKIIDNYLKGIRSGEIEILSFFSIDLDSLKVMPLDFDVDDILRIKIKSKFKNFSLPFEYSNLKHIFYDSNYNKFI